MKEKEKGMTGNFICDEKLCSLRNDINAFIGRKFKVKPEYPWKSMTDGAVYRHADNRKWFALMMGVRRDRLGLAGTDVVDVINVKAEDPFLRDLLFRQEGILPGYHMNKMHWISILLDGSVDQDTICSLICDSYAATASRKRKQEIRAPKEWIIPANPKYYDIEHAFDDGDVIEWKQSSSVKPRDTVYLYVAAPVSAILYKCSVLETDIPYQYDSKDLHISRVMRIRLQKRFRPDRFTFAELKEQYGIFAVRGPRSVPNKLSHALKNARGVS